MAVLKLVVYVWLFLCAWLMLCAARSHAPDRSYSRSKRQREQIRLDFRLFSNSTAECRAGLSSEGVSVTVSYRTSTDSGRWIPMRRIFAPNTLGRTVVKLLHVGIATCISLLNISKNSVRAGERYHYAIIRKKGKESCGIDPLQSWSLGLGPLVHIYYTCSTGGPHGLMQSQWNYVQQEICCMNFADIIIVLVALTGSCKANEIMFNRKSAAGAEI